MKLRLLGFSTTLAVALTVPAVLAGCDGQPAIQCTVGHAGSQFGYAIVFTKKAGDDCSPVTADVMGAETFHGADAKTNTRNNDIDRVAIKVGAILNDQQSHAACWSADDPVSGYKAPMDFTDTTSTPFSIGDFKDLSPDAQDICPAEGMTTAELHVPAIPETTADGNPAPTGCPDSPALLCDNGDGTQNPGCVCAAAGDDSCCDRFFKYCDDDLTACTQNSDCVGAAKCSDQPIKVCLGGDPNTGLQVACDVTSDCDEIAVALGAMPGDVPCAPTSVSFCSNDATILGCASDDDCCAPTDTNCLSKPHTCNPGGVDFASCHTAAQDPVDIKFEWSNVEFYETAGAPGTQMQADLAFTNGACAETFSVRAMWPAIDCTARDADGNPLTDAMGAPKGDPTFCCPGADPANGKIVGSGINGDFETVCVPAIGLDGNPPNAFNNNLFFTNTASYFVCALDVKKGFPTLNDSGNPSYCPKLEEVK